LNEKKGFLLAIEQNMGTINLLTIKYLPVCVIIMQG